MKLKKIFKYGFIATCLLGNALAMDHADDLPKNAVPRHQSMLAIKAASDTASLESRQLHILFGAHPSETHVVHLRAAEEKREKEEGIKAPIRLFFVNACELYGEQALSPKTPILNADFNKEESWDTILEALKLNEESFNGVFDKMYFDVSTAKAASWGESILAKITILLKKSGELYIPDVKLFSQSSFCESTVDMATYSKLTKTEKNALPYPPYLNTPVYPLSPPFLLGRCTAEVIKRGDIGYVYNRSGLVYDTDFQASRIGDHPLKFETFKDDKMYPDIGMKYRPEPEEVHQYFRINSFIKVTSGAEKRTFPSAAADETEEQVEPELTQKPSSTETAAEISLEEGYKEIKFPSLGMIKEKLLLGSSTIGSETDSFHVQTIFGIFLGFSFTEDFDLKMIGVGISGSNGSYGLCGFFKVMVEGNKNIPIFLKSAYRQENGYRVRGGTQVKDGNFYMVSDPEQIRIMKV